MRFFAWKENFSKADALIVENRPLPMFLCRVLASRGIKRSEEHTSELQSH